MAPSLGPISISVNSILNNRYPLSIIRSFPGKCSNDLYSLVPPTQSLVAKIHFTVSSGFYSKQGDNAIRTEEVTGREINWEVFSEKKEQ